MPENWSDSIIVSSTWLEFVKINIFILDHHLKEMLCWFWSTWSQWIRAEGFVVHLCVIFTWSILYVCLVGVCDFPELCYSHRSLEHWGKWSRYNTYKYIGAMAWGRIFDVIYSVLYIKYIDVSCEIPQPSDFVDEGGASKDNWRNDLITRKLSMCMV